jgi:DNA-binding response OmpR family regulator
VFAAADRGRSDPEPTGADGARWTVAIVLVVDDDRDVRDLISMTLSTHHLIHAIDGAEALEKLAQQRVDAVILDIMMARLDGIEVLRRIRSDARQRDLPVIMLSARTGEDDHLRSYQSGADAYVTKPFEPETLAQVVDDVLRRSPEERERYREAEKEKAALLRQLERRFR